MTCIKIPNGILCVGTPMIRLGEHGFEMHPYMGPVKLRKDGEPAVKYAGTFDCKRLAESIPLPGPTEHKANWDRLYSAFDRAWAVH